MQCRVGALMYSSGSCSPDIAYPTHQLARCVAKPTPQVIAECDHVLNYLAATRHLGITSSPSATDTLSAMADASWEVKKSTSMPRSHMVLASNIACRYPPLRLRLSLCGSVHGRGVGPGRDPLKRATLES